MAPEPQIIKSRSPRPRHCVRTRIYARSENRSGLNAAEAIAIAAPVQARDSRVLLVDEIVTSGDTLRLALAAIRDIGAAEVQTATSFARVNGYKPDYFALATDSTIMFPWDRKIFEEDRLVTNPRYEGALDE